MAFPSPSASRAARLAVIASTLALAAGPASASLFWDWSYSTTGISAGGTLTTEDTPDGQGFYRITGITGTRNGVAITGLIPTGDAIPGNAGFPVDNLIRTGTGQMTHSGFGYSLADGHYGNPYYADFLTTPIYYEVYTQPFLETPVSFSATLSGVPEPASLALLSAGVGAFGLTSRRRKAA